MVPPISEDENKKEIEEEINQIYVYQIRKEDRRQPLIDYLEQGKLPSETRRISLSSVAVEFSIN